MTQNQDLQLASDLRTAVSRLTKKLRKKSITGQGLSMTERSSLVLLHQNKEMLPSELASMEKITNQSMSQILGHLMELGYINRKASETDKRKVIISLTAAGEEMILRVRSERDEWLAKAIEATCDEEEIERIKKAIGPLTKLIDFD